MRFRLKNTRVPALLAVTLLWLSGCHRASQTSLLDSSPAQVRLPVVRVIRKTVPELVMSTGTVTALPNHSVNVGAAAAGKLIAVFAAVGQEVKPGDLLAEQDPRQAATQLHQNEAALQAASADVLQARANAALARSTLARQQSLYTDKIIPKKDLLAAQSQAENGRALLSAALGRKKGAQALLDQASTQLELTKIKSPIHGIVARRFLNIGDQADPATPIVQIVDLSTINIQANLPADAPVNVRAGDPAEIRTAAHPDEAFAGTVISVSPVVDPQSNTIPLQIRSQNKAGKLFLGLSVTALITTGKHPDALVIPESALVPDPEHPGANMVCVVRNRTLQRVPVRLGITWQGTVEVRSGLSPNELIVASGAYGLPDGTQIDPVSGSRP